MKAMILAAGLGTRLRPLTDRCPKALVEIAGRPMLEIAIARLRAAGVRELIINVHHFADMIADYLKANNNFGLRIEISREETLLDTGGGLKQAAWFFLKDSGKPEEPFFLHNVDVVSTIDLGRMLRFHAEQRALATLAVQRRESSRYLLFDEQLQLGGRQTGPDAPPEIVRSSPHLEARAFCGIHVISPRLLAMMTEELPPQQANKSGDRERVFSIISSYLKLAARGEKIVSFDADEYAWCDLGTPERVRRAAQQITDLPTP